MSGCGSFNDFKLDAEATLLSLLLLLLLFTP